MKRTRKAKKYCIRYDTQNDMQQSWSGFEGSDASWFFPAKVNQAVNIDVIID